MFITIEGGEGAGKSTQIKMLEAALQAKGHSVIITREPGGTEFAEKIRSLMLDSDEITDPLVEFLLLTAGRIDHVNKLIKPALKENNIVISDRFSHSTIVYQCLVKGMSRTVYNKITALTLGNFKPDMTVYLDIDPLLAQERLQKRKVGLPDGNHYDNKELEFHKQIREGFLSFRNEPGFVIIDASQSIEEVHKQICSTIELIPLEK